MLTDHDKAIRERRIGASEVAAVLGISPYADATPFSVWARLTQGYQRPEVPELTAGRYLERAVLDWFADQRDLMVHRGAALVRSSVHPEHDWFSCTPDAEAEDPNGTLCGIEAKTERRSDAWGTPGTDQVPVHVAAQCQAQCAVRGYPQVYVPVLFKGEDRFERYLVPRDEVVIDHIIRECGAWYARHVIGGEMPPLDGGNAAASYLRKRYPGGAPLAVATPEQRAMVTAYSEQKATIKRLTSEADIMRQRIALELGDSNGWDGLCTFKPNKKGVRSLLLTAEKE